MKVLLLLVVLVSAVYISTADEDNCYLEDIREIHWTYGYTNPDVNDTHVGIVKVFKSENVTGVSVDEATYLNAYIEDDEVYVYATNSFKYFEGESPYMYYPTVSVNILFNCSIGERKLRFDQDIIDTNNNAPFFYQDEYVLRLAMSVPQGMDLTKLFAVIASDFDITNSYLHLEFKEEEAAEYLSVDYRAYQYSKLYTPVIKTTSALEKPLRKSFTLAANDSGEPTLSYSTIITVLVIDPEDVVPSPVFNRSLTIANYNGEELLLLDPIGLKTGQGSTYQIIQKGLEDYITVEWNTEEESLVMVSLNNPIPKEKFTSGFVTMEIIARHDYSFQHGKTTLLINMK